MPDERLTGWGWAGLGLAGSFATAAAGSDLIGSQGISWWFKLHLPPGHGANVAVFYAGLTALCVAWLGLGRCVRRTPGIEPARLVIIGAVWCVPLLAGPPLFSRDVYSYLAQGEILHLGLNPYHAAPEVLGRLGRPHLLAAVSPFWRATTSPYGPLFLAITSVVAGAVGSNLVLGVLLMRAIEVVGLALLAVFVPRLARSLGTDPSRATWLAVISPLVLLELVAAGHNDALMVGLLVAGMTLAMERRPLLGITLCAVAATVKVPAAAAVAFIAVPWARAELSASGGGRVRAARALVLSGTVTVAVLAAVSAATGVGLSWISGSVLSAPGKVHLAITPTTATGWSLASLLHLIGIGANAKAIESALGTVALALTVLLALALILRTRRETMVLRLGVLLVVSVFAGPATWPWYLTWGLALIACCPVGARSRALPAAVVLAAFLVKPDGILALPLGAAPFVLAAYLIAAGAAWRYHKPQGGSPASGWFRARSGREQPALTNS